MERILVTTDFSSNSKAGIRFAIQLSKQTNCEITFYHLIEVMKPTSWNETHYKKFERELLEKNITKLERFVTEQYMDAGLVKGNHRYIAEIGTRVDELVIKQAKKIKANFICTSTRGAGKIKKLFGTHSSALITNSPIPIIIVPQGYRIKPITSVFYASDFAAIKREIGLVKLFADKVRATVDVLHYDYLIHVEEVRKRLAKKVESLNIPDIKFHFKKQQIEDSIHKHLSEDVRKLKPSLIVLFTKQNRNWFDRLFARKESAEMSFNAKVPLLIFRKKQ
jgi:nucleotide-binding universal stress UspA family protein